MFIHFLVKNLNCNAVETAALSSWCSTGSIHAQQSKTVAMTSVAWIRLSVGQASCLSRLDDDGQAGRLSYDAGAGGVGGCFFAICSSICLRMSSAPTNL